MNQENRFYNFDINMTEGCNLRCTYCIQNFNKSKFENLSPELTEKIIEKFDYLLKDKQFMDKFGGIRISFWGGEPTTNLEGIKKFTEHYKHNNNVVFFMYSNGFDFSKIYDFLEQFKNIKIKNEPKFLVQISYDGLASHGVDRLTIKGKDSSLKVKETVFELARRDIPFSIHPTISSKNFDKIAENYFEFRKMSDTLGLELNYSPTIDYMSKYDFSETELLELTETLKKEFFKIKDEEVNFFKNKGYFSFGWMNPNKAICAAGCGYSGIQLDGSIYACHGVFNESYMNDVKLNDINFENMKFTTELIKSSDYHAEILQSIPKGCQECNTHYCLKCNSTKFAVSEKTEYAEKWTDYGNQPGLCYIFKFIGKYRMALMRYIQTH